MSRQKIVISQEERNLICARPQSNENKGGRQLERDLEEELIKILTQQGYEYIKIKNEDELKDNLRKQLEKLNRNNDRKKDFSFSDNEWRWFYREYLEGPRENEGFVNRTKKIQGHEFKKLLRKDNGTTLNINFIDKTNPSRNHLQVINQYSDFNKKVRYDVTILVNGLPLVQIELKKRAGSLRDAFNQIKRYSECGFSKLFEFIQIFVISNGTETKYYSNSTRNNQEINSFLMTSFWATWDNETIRDLRDFARTFLAPNTILQMLTKYCVLDSDNNLKILRPYQIAAIEGIIEKIELGIESKDKSGGYVWHTTGSGKTLTSFKAAQTAIEIPKVKKVLFIVDRRDLDHQTTKEYRKFLGESEEQTIDNTNNTNKLRELLNTEEERIIITTIQKLRILLDPNKNSIREDTREVLDEKAKEQTMVIIMDECHRSQTENIHKLIEQFKNVFVFGFTGTPKFILSKREEEEDHNETQEVFGNEIHTYKIVDAIKDENVLKFYIDYVGDRQHIEEHTDRHMMESKSRIASIVQYIIGNFHIKTNTSTNLNQDQDHMMNENRFNSIFAVKSIDVAIQYYKEFEEQLKESRKNIKVAIIFSAVDYEEESEENNSSEKMEKGHKKFLEDAIEKYNKVFGCEIKNFNDYRNDVSQRVKNKEIDILIVVNMFLTGFDAQRLNTIWIDKHLEGHNLIQAFSRTNRIYDRTKPHGNIICFRYIKDEVDRAIAKFAAHGADGSRLVTVRGLKERLEEFRSIEDAIIEKFPLDHEIIGESAEKEFVKLWKKYLETFKSLKHDEDLIKHTHITHEQKQDYSSLYRGIFEKYQKLRESSNEEDLDALEIDDFSFDLELLRSDEVNIDYIIGLLSNYWKTKNNKDDILRYVRTNSALRPEESLIKEFLEQIDKGNETLEYKEFKKAKIDEKIENLIKEEELKPEGTKRFIKKCLENKEISFDGIKAREEIMKDMDMITEFKKYKESWERVQEKIRNIFELLNAW